MLLFCLLPHLSNLDIERSLSMSRRREVLLTDEQWEKVKRFIPRVAHPTGGPPRADDGSCFGGILWVLKSGARWKDLPDRLPLTKYVLAKATGVG